MSKDLDFNCVQNFLFFDFHSASTLLHSPLFLRDKLWIYFVTVLQTPYIAQALLRAISLKFS